MELSAVEQLLQFTNSILPLNTEEETAFASHWQARTAKRKTILTAAGEKERYLYFVIEGVQRAFHVSDEGKEASIVFTYPFSFSGVADSFLTQTASLYFFETLTASSFLQLDYQHFQYLLNTYPGIQQLFFKATSFALKGALERHIELQHYSNEQKFRTMLTRSPHMLNLVPHKYLASYLGMDVSQFSKLLNTTKL